MTDNEKEIVQKALAKIKANCTECISCMGCSMFVTVDNKKHCLLEPPPAEWRIETIVQVLAKEED